MIEEKNINLCVNGITKLRSVKITRSYDAQGDINSVTLKVIEDGIEYESHSGIMEGAVINLQKQLPQGVQIVCCQSCRYGNFCPYGDQENEIFCLKDYASKNNKDITELFSTGYEELTRNELLFWCEDYKEIDEDYYTYNSGL